MGVDIIEARKNTTSYAKATDMYPKGSDEFTYIDAYQVTNIVLENELITFDVNGGGNEINLSVGNVQSDDVQCTKVLYNGQVYIIRNGAVYDLNGRLVKAQ